MTYFYHELLRILLATVAAAACSSGVVLSTPTPDAGGPFTAPETPTAQPTATPTAPADAGAEPLTTLGVSVAFEDLSFARMVDLKYPDDDTSRLFLVLQPGRIMVFENDRNVEAAGEFLDIRDSVSDAGNEEGLLGLAFDPAYRTNGHFYVYYSASSPRRSVVSRFTVSNENADRAEASTERVVLEVPQPFSNHNGGQLLFGPDGHLYIGLGDGGSGGDPFRNGQDVSTLLGSILRIDVSGLDDAGAYVVPPDNPLVGRAGAREEIWAYGLRNPWRFTFDRQTGDLWAADVGQDEVEEVDLIRPGLNYGWNVLEGFECFSSCVSIGLEPPIVQYGRADGCSITGGYVYRGSRLPSLDGAYVYGDFCSGKLWALRYNGDEVTEHMELIDSRLRISAFGEDRDAELLILSFDGRIYRFEER